MSCADPVKGRYKDHRIVHSLDMWHGAKNLAKRLQAVRVAVLHMVFSHIDVHKTGY